MADSNLPTQDSPVARQTNEGESSETSGPSCCNKEVTVEPLSFLASATLVPSCDRDVICSCTCDTSNCCEEERDLLAANLQMHFISRADDIHKNLVEGLSDGESLAASLPIFLFTCQPYFNYLESTARSSLNEKSPLSVSTRFKLLDFSETLVNKLENLVLTFFRQELIPLDETDPNSVSHFHIGQCELGPMRVTIFRYCQPTPYLGLVNTGLYKRMRWNVDRVEDTSQKEQNEGMEMDNTEYYFLCFEDALPDGDVEGISYGSIVREWSIGQWIQAFPETNDINEWILCQIPQGTYLKRVILGPEEPSCHIATDCLLQLLMLDHNNLS